MSTVGAGRAGESRGVRVLRAAGFVIVERNYCCPLGEIDVVARDGTTLVFV
jgi:putative endonuclease